MGMEKMSMDEPEDPPRREKFSWSRESNQDELLKGLKLAGREIVEMPHNEHISVALTIKLLKQKEQRLLEEQRTGQHPRTWRNSENSPFGNKGSSGAERLEDVIRENEESLNNISIALPQLEGLPDQSRGLYAVLAEVEAHLNQKNKELN